MYLPERAVSNLDLLNVSEADDSRRIGEVYVYYLYKKRTLKRENVQWLEIPSGVELLVRQSKRNRCPRKYVIFCRLSSNHQTSI